MTAAINLHSLHGRVALVTGASRGLGFQIALGLARAGVQVLINSRSAEHVAAAVDRLVREGLPAAALPFDVADEAAAATAIAEIEQRHGRLDILVNNVGARLRIPLEDTTPEAFASLVQTNLSAAFALTRRAAALMIPKRHGRIIMLSSVAAQRAAPGNIAYIAAKGGLDALTRAFACEYGPFGVTCNAIAPGSFLTETNAAALSGAVREAIEARVPLRRVGDPAEIAGPAVFLASDGASYVNGHVLNVDGGFATAW